MIIEVLTDKKVQIDSLPNPEYSKVIVEAKETPYFEFKDDKEAENFVYEIIDKYNLDINVS